jgi:outer membrane receptor for ferrienterochelin and colicin
VGSLATAFRAPNIIERLFNGPTPEGAGFQILNPDLTSEESVSWDLGVKYRRRDAYFEAIWFQNEIRDGILQDFLTAAEIAALPAATRREIADSGFDVVVQERNVDALRYEGIEVTFGSRAASGLAAGANYTHLTAERTGPAAVPVEDHFSDKINAHLRWQPPRGRWWAEYRLRHNGDEPTRVDPEEPLPAIGDTLPAFTLHTLAGGVTLFERGARRHELAVVLDNLTDELYAEFSNAAFFRPEPGRSATVSYRVSF